MKLEVHIARSSADGKRTRCRQTYRLSIPEDEEWTAMDVLDFIQRRLDGTVAYPRHCICHRGVCRHCAVRINGRIGFLCTHLIRNEPVLVLEPLSEARRIRDLLCR